MPTSKKRLNLTLPTHLAVFLKKISLRDEMPQAAKALELIERGLEMEEGEFTEEFVREVKRRVKHDKLIPAKKVFKELW
jgi:predicted DNA-binding protein